MCLLVLRLRNKRFSKLPRIAQNGRHNNRKKLKFVHTSASIMQMSTIYDNATMITLYRLAASYSAVSLASASHISTTLGLLLKNHKRYIPLAI